MDSKVSVKQDDESSPPASWRRQTAHQCAHKGGNCNNGWTFLSHPFYSPDLAPSNFHLFGALKDALRGRRFADDDEIWHNLREEHRRFSKDANVMLRLRQTRKKGVDNEGDFVEK